MLSVVTADAVDCAISLGIVAIVSTSILVARSRRPPCISTTDPIEIADTETDNAIATPFAYVFRISGVKSVSDINNMALNTTLVTGSLLLPGIGVVVVGSKVTA